MRTLPQSKDEGVGARTFQGEGSFSKMVKVEQSGAFKKLVNNGGRGGGGGFWGQKGDWGIAADEGNGNPDTGLPTDHQELGGAVSPELGVRWGQP